MTQSADIAVVGSGAAGIAAAVCAARAGCHTLLLDAQDSPGGTGGFSGLTTLCGLYDDDGRFLNDGLAREFAGQLAEGPAVRMGRVWVLPYRPEKFRELAALLLGNTPGIETFWNTPVTAVFVDTTALNADLATGAKKPHGFGTEHRLIPDTTSVPSVLRPESVRNPAKGSRILSLNGIRVGAVIDCTGSAEVARVAGIDCLETTNATQAPATVFPLRHVMRVPETPAEMARVLLPLVREGLPPLSLQPCLERDCVTAKFAGLPEQVPALIACLRANVRSFKHCETSPAEVRFAHRAGRMVCGQYLLTGEDVLAARKFPDAVARCAWPIEQWNADGVARLRYLPAGAHCEIPARSLRAAGIENLFMAGKTISANVDAIASARVMGCCLATGAAAGNLAAAFLKSATR